MSEARTEGSTEFAKRMLRTMNEAALALMVSVGHRTGLFDVMAAMPAATSAELASRALLDERYVREWLAVMTTGRIVEHDGATGSYSLPADHAAWLTRAAGMKNLATGMQYIGLMALVEDQIVDCFRRGGGVPYSAFPRFQTVMAEDSGAVHDATLIDVTLPLVPGLIDSLRQGIEVADVGCGSGHAVNLMAEAFPRSRFAGFDFSEPGSPRPAWGRKPKASRTRASANAMPPASARSAGSTSSPPSTRCTTRPGRTWCSPGSPGHCAPAGFTCASTPPPQASSPRTWTTRSGRICTPCPACTA
jgi:hypothetical protein